MSRLRFPFICLSLFAFYLAPARAAEPFRFPEARHGKGELRYINTVPVLTLEGTPEEIGEQLGKLGVKPSKQLHSIIQDFLKAKGLDKAWPLLAKAGNGMLPQFPEAHRREMEATARGAEIDRDLLIVMNTIPDMMKLGGCSTLIVGKEKSATGAPLFGRNLDVPPFGNLHEFGIVMIYKQPGKHTFASIIFPGAVGVSSGINDAGLAITANEIYAAKDNSPMFDTTGTPMGSCIRRVMEECTTVAEAEKLLRSLKRTTMISLTVCDKDGGAVFEVTPKSLFVRSPEEGICCCTNHFITSELSVHNHCNRLPKLEQTRALAKLGIEDIRVKLHEVNQGRATMQTMVLEPATLQLHLSIIDPPSSAHELKRLDLAALFGSKAVKRAGD